MSSDPRAPLAPLSGATVPLRAPQMAWQRVDGELVLLAIEGKELLGLNEVAARVWELVDDERDLATIASQVASEFEIDAETAFTDVATFVTDLVARGIVQLRDAGG